MLRTIEEMVAAALERRASDIHLSEGNPVMFRIDGKLLPAEEEPLTGEDISAVWQKMIDEPKRRHLEETGELDFSISSESGSRLRVNLFRQRGSYAMVFRILPSHIPDPKELGIPEAVMDLTGRKRGLVLVTGATGSGKSTTLASMIHKIAMTYEKHIITLEDPIEYLHKTDKSVVVQREVGSDTLSYANALRAALRQDPDVILVGEMRDLETISTAITAAETGHLVFSTLHTNSAASTIERIIDVFPPHQQGQVRTQLANVLEGIVCQQLLNREREPGRVAAFEVMLANSAIRNLIRENKTHQITTMMQTGKKNGMQMMDEELVNLYNRRIISGQTAVDFAQDPAAMEQKVILF